MSVDVLAMAERWDQQVLAARQTEIIGDILAVAEMAVEALEAVIGRPVDPGSAQAAALMILRKITYNSAADAYPGWAVDAPPRTAAQLGAAARLARKSLSLVEELQEDAENYGHAVWLIGAIALARGARAEAVAEFCKAAAFFAQADAPLMVALAQGYAGMAAGDAAAFAAAQAKISPEDEHAQAVVAQLRIGWQLYGLS